ncbi:MAG TPA: alkaline phosphatase family protein [Planctomicrobium sp.]|nr:alkaline phosphatase family protein [Planctomicrobium sp.]
MVRILNCLLALCLMALPSVQADEPAQGRVLIIGIDGTRPDAIAKGKTPNLDRLISEGAFTDSAQILGDRYDKNNTISGPGWSSILTGVWADKHGVHDNTFKGRNYELFPHFFKHLKQVRPDAVAVSLVSWGPIHEFILSEGDIAEYIPLPVVKNQVVDVRAPGDKAQINTRDGKWHHLLASRKEGTIKLYLDGKEISGKASGNDLFDLSGKFLYLGRDSRTDGTCFQGMLDDVRIWNRALSEQEIGSIAAGSTTQSLNREGLVAEYLFDVINAPYQDTAGHDHGPYHAQPVSKKPTHQLVDNSRDGVRSQAVNFSSRSGKEHGLRIPLSPELASLPQGDFTVEARFLTTEAGRGILLGNYSSKAGAINLELHESNAVRAYVQPQTISPTSGLQREDQRDGIIANKAVSILKDENPDAMFVYFHQVDATGHSIGFSPDVPEYVNAIENVDQHVGTVMTALQSRPNYVKENWIVIVCTDHGGIKKTHSNGHQIPEIRTVFLIVSGNATRVGRIEEQAYLVDVTATALKHLTGTVDSRLQLDGRAVGLK